MPAETKVSFVDPKADGWRRPLFLQRGKYYKDIEVGNRLDNGRKTGYETHNQALRRGLEAVD